MPVTLIHDPIGALSKLARRQRISMLVNTCRHLCACRAVHYQCVCSKKLGVVDAIGPPTTVFLDGRS